MTTRDSQWERCGEGTEWGCGEIVEHPGRILLHGRPGVRSGVHPDPGHVMFHPACFPDIATRPAFSRGLAAEDAARSER